MNLRTLAEADNATILEDDVNGFATDIKVTRIGAVPAVAAVLTISLIGTTGTVVPLGTRWKIGTRYYAQNAAVTLAPGVATATITAEVAGAAGNLNNGNALELVAPISGLFGAAIIASTVTPGTDIAGSTVYNLKGMYWRVGVEIDPETGLLVAGSKSAVTLRLSRFPINALPDNGDLVEAVDSNGVTVKGYATNVMLDRTAGRVTLLFRK